MGKRSVQYRCAVNTAEIRKTEKCPSVSSSVCFSLKIIGNVSSKTQPFHYSGQVGHMTEVVVGASLLRRNS